MEHQDKMILFAILGTVGLFVLFVLRRIARQKDAQARPEPVSPPVEAPALKVAAPIASVEAPTVPVVAVVAEPKPDVEVPVIVVAEEIAPVASPAPAPKKKRQPKRVGQTPIAAALDMLTKPNALAATFVLREILAPPVSRRQSVKRKRS